MDLYAAIHLDPRLLFMHRIGSVFYAFRFPRIHADLAQRRRTQIRLAQRSYRQRKENTISGLSTRVLSLEHTIEDMSKVFQEFHEKAVESQALNTTVADNLADSLQRFVELAKNGTHVSAESDEGEDESGKRVSDVLSSRNVRPKEHSTRQELGSPEVAPMSLLGYQAVYDESDEETSLVNTTSFEGFENIGWDPVQRQNFEAVNKDSEQYGETTSTARLQQASQNPDRISEPAPGDQDMQQYRALIPEVIEEGRDWDPKPKNRPFISVWHPTITQAQALSSLLVARELPLPQSYSFYESSFARRLIRAAYESFLYVTDPAIINRACNFTFCFTSSPDLRKALLGLLGRSKTENLESWKNISQYHLGGAGLHFPRVRGVGIDASSEPPPDWVQDTYIGPRPPIDVETPLPSTMTMAEIIEHVGFEGEWFDANDVEHYLRTKGLYLDGLSRIVEVKEPDEAYVPRLDSGAEANQDLAGGGTVGSPFSSMDGMSPPGSPENSHKMPSLFVDGVDNDYFWDQESMRVPALSNAMPGLNMDIDHSYGQASGKAFEPVFDPKASFQGQMPTFNPKAKKFLDVEKFLESKFLLKNLSGPQFLLTRSASDLAVIRLSLSYAWVSTQCD